MFFFKDNPWQDNAQNVQRNSAGFVWLSVLHSIVKNTSVHKQVVAN